MRGLRTMQRSARLVRSRFVSGSVILLYHRIADPIDDPYSMNVSAARFAEHLEAIRRLGQPLRLVELIAGVERRSVPPRGIVVTFDDGYADNLTAARPLLERFEIPATVFVTSGLVGKEGECWWDALSRLIRRAKNPSGPLRLTIDGRTRDLKSSDPVRLLRRVHGLLRPLEADHRGALLAEIGRWADTRPPAQAAHRMLTAGELKELAVSPMIDIGAHTVTHPVLSALSEDRARHELEASKRALEAIVGHPVTTCAYPYGLASDYSLQTVDVARQVGYRAACTAIPDVVWRGSDRFQLPRLWIDDWSADAFARKLGVWLRG